MRWVASLPAARIIFVGLFRRMRDYRRIRAGRPSSAARSSDAATILLILINAAHSIRQLPSTRNPDRQPGSFSSDKTGKGERNA